MVVGTTHKKEHLRLENLGRCPTWARGYCKQGDLGGCPTWVRGYIRKAIWADAQQRRKAKKGGRKPFFKLSVRETPSPYQAEGGPGLAGLMTSS
jgi:hypothetical protein